VEFISAAVEGTLIGLAGILIIIEAVRNLSKPHEITALDKGMILVGVTAVVNFAAGAVCEHYGKKNNSLALIASGKHLKSDVYTTLGILFGLFLLFLTGIKWIDSAVAILFAVIILVTAYRIIRSSMAGIMDEADEELLLSLVASLEANRKEDWIDLHNLRIIKYGGTLHLDMHLTVPWYFNVHEAHRVVDDISELVRGNFGESVELFIHTDGCLDFSCPLCTKKDCSQRKQDFVRRIPWTMENVVNNSKHRI
jgi:cation diffusion facilitator family transporter